MPNIKEPVMDTVLFNVTSLAIFEILNGEEMKIQANIVNKEQRTCKRRKDCWRECSWQTYPLFVLACDNTLSSSFFFYPERFSAFPIGYLAVSGQKVIYYLFINVNKLGNEYQTLDQLETFHQYLLTTQTGVPTFGWCIHSNWPLLLLMMLWSWKGWFWNKCCVCVCVRASLCARPWGVCVKQDSLLLFPGWFMLWRLPLRSQSHYWKGGRARILCVCVCTFVCKSACSDVVVTGREQHRPYSAQNPTFFLSHTFYIYLLSQFVNGPRHKGCNTCFDGD